MKQFEKILVATDFSRSGGNALQMATTLARTFGSALFLAHVIPVVKDAPFVVESLKSMVWKRLQDLEKTLGEQGVPVADTLVAIGSPFDEITKLAELLDVNAILVNAGNTWSNGEFILALTPERLARTAKRPVWLVKPQTNPTIRKILCPVDFSNPSRRALANAIRLAKALHAELCVLTVIESLANICASSANVTIEAQERYAQRQRDDFEQFLDGIEFGDVPWTKVIRYGTPHPEILELAAELPADLIVMGSLGRACLPQNWIGSVAERVIRGMPCSVVTMKPDLAGSTDSVQEAAQFEARLGLPTSSNGKEIVR